MTMAYPGGGIRSTIAAEFLSLAAAPTFATMALLTSIAGDGHADIVCSAGHGPWLGGMVPMYLLMSAFHAGAWLRLASCWANGSPRQG